MTKQGFHPMVILWSSYGDPMVRVLFGSYLSLILGLYGVAGRYTRPTRGWSRWSTKNQKKCKFICIYEKNIVILQPEVRELTFTNIKS